MERAWFQDGAITRMQHATLSWFDVGIVICFCQINVNRQHPMVGTPPPYI
jgi:hypothetical protein